MDWFYELCEELEPIIKDAANEFCRENNLTLENISKEIYYEYSVPTTTFEVTVVFNGKVLKESITFNITIRPDLKSKKAKIFVEGEKKKLITTRKTCQKVDKLRNSIKKAILYSIENELNKYVHADRFLELLNKIKDMISSDVSLCYNPSFISFGFGDDSIAVFLTFDPKQRELKIAKIKIELSTKLRTVLFLDVLINYYGYKDIINYVDENVVHLDISEKNKNEQLEILSKVIELVKMYNLFS